MVPKERLINFEMRKSNKNFMPYAFLGVGLVALIAWVAWGFFSTYNIETPDYTAETRDGYELRDYEGYIVAFTEVEAKDRNEATNKGFLRLADYIFGNNTAAKGNGNEKIAMTAPVLESEDQSEKIAMTAPVIEEIKKDSEEIAMTAPVLEEERENSYVISFTMPKKYTLETLPTPNSDLVKLKAIKPYKAAAIRFSWWPTDSRIEAKTEELLELVKKDGFEVIGEPQKAFYNPPWTPPFMLRNEIWVEIK